MSASFHRIVDGRDAAEFIQRIKGLLELRRMGPRSVIAVAALLACAAGKAGACTIPMPPPMASGEEREAFYEALADRGADSLIGRSTSIFLARVTKADAKGDGTVWLRRIEVLRGAGAPRDLRVRDVDRPEGSCGSRYRFGTSEAKPGRQVLVFYGRDEGRRRPGVLDMIKADHDFASRVLGKLRHKAE